MMGTQLIGGGPHSRVDAFVILATVLALAIDQLYHVTLAGGVGLSLQTFALLASSLAILLQFVIRPYLPRPQAIGVLMALLVWCWVEALRSVDVGRSITYLLLLAMSALLYFEMSLRDPAAILERLNRTIYWVGSAITVVLFSRYMYIVTHKAADIIADRNLWEVGSGDVYEVQLGGAIAYQGLSGDPNAVAISLAIILFCGLSVRLPRFDAIRHVLNGILIIAILASNSRGALAALAVSLVIGAVLLRGMDYRKYLLALGAGAAALWLVVAWRMNWMVGLSNPLYKIERASSYRRFHEWSRVWEAFSERPIAGGGLRYSESLLGKYTENSYLTILADSGLLGLVSFGLLLGAPTIAFVWLGRHRMRDMQAVVPWFVYAVFLLVTMVYVSMEVKPILWVTCGILAGAVLASPSRYGEMLRRSAVQ